jgi:hypothetical protein
VEVTVADLLAWDRERGEPPLSQGFSVIEKEKKRSPAPELFRPVIQPLAADSGHKETGMSITARLR